MQDLGVDQSEDKSVYNLLTHLRKEKVLVRNEKHQIQKLNKLIQRNTDSLIQETWVAVKQRLYLLSRPEFTSQNYEHTKVLANAEFSHAKTVLGFQATVQFEDLFDTLRVEPEQLAKWLLLGEQIADDSVQFTNILHSLVTGLYSSCIFSNDTHQLLKLLYELAKLQLMKNQQNPRRMLKQNVSFKTLYFAFHEVLPSAKFFLNGTLEIPILRLLSYKEFHLDIDPEKTLQHYWQNASLKSEFRDLQEYRNEVTRILSEITNQFVASLRENVYSFPKCIGWIIHQISKIVSKSNGPKEANAVVTELLFTLYICPAIVDPEQYSICDTQISNVARHNLIQVAQILQILALNKYERPDPKYRDVYKLLDNDAIANFIDEVLYNGEYDDDIPPVDIAPNVARTSAVFSEEELHNLVIFLQKIQNTVQTEMVANGSGDGLKMSFLDDHIASLSVPSSVENSPKNSKPYANGYSDASKRINFMSIMGKNQYSSPVGVDDPAPTLTVLVFGFDRQFPELIGLLSEHRVIENATATQKSTSKSVTNPGNLQESKDAGDDVQDGGEAQGAAPDNGDGGSIGNTSDNLEAISEAASNHSVASSLDELEENDQNDNLSDMISANVSGRGSPNISGRDTPSSQVNENEERPMPEARLPPPAQPMSRQIRSEIDDKFCKFEIKKLMEGDETVSLISETWSTDVLASDNETVDSENVRNVIVDPVILGVPGVHHPSPANNVLLDLSETQSESAWSTDVMASDTERLTEVENDDVASVAQSDETRSEIDDNVVTIRRPSNTPTFQSYYQEYHHRKVEMKSDLKTDSNANNVLYKTLTTTSSTTTTSMTTTANVTENAPSSSSSSSYDLKTAKDCPGPSGFHRGGVIRPSEMLLSNSSLNSSSSGSSGSYEASSSRLTTSTQALTDSQASGTSKRPSWLEGSSESSLNVTSTTPSESTSELSVLSVNQLNLNQPILLSKGTNLMKSATVMTARNLKPSASTGAIPKSISFDTSADKVREDDDRVTRKGSFFGKLKMGFKNRRVKSFRHHDEFNRNDDDESVDGKKTPGQSPVKLNNDVSEDILAKYRTKPFMESSSKSTNGGEKTLGVKSNRSSEDSDLTADNTFDDIKKKLRIVLSDTASPTPELINEKGLSIKNKIETILRVELAKSRKLKEYTKIARISEALRFIALSNESSCANLVQSMHEDIVQRSIYTRYLIDSRQQLLICLAHLETLAEQIRDESRQCEEYLAAVCLKQFLLKEEDRIVTFCQEFKEVSLSDEKCDFLNAFYEQIYQTMWKNELWHSMWKDCGDAIKVALERVIMSNVYSHALYPNGDGDRHRDHVLYQHIANLAKIITPDHKALMIHKMYLRELPWIPAQDALKVMGAYKTPRDKVNCVVHCAKCIMDLLAFSQNSGSTTADDFTPVLVYVIIRVNPPDLLSTVQFVNTFLQNQLGGEELYWWTQFCSAVEFIKTMDYSD